MAEAAMGIEQLVDDVLAEVFRLGSVSGPFMLLPYTSPDYFSNENPKFETKTRVVSKEKVDRLDEIFLGLSSSELDEGQKASLELLNTRFKNDFLHPYTLMLVSKRWHNIVLGIREFWRFYLGNPELLAPDYGERGFCSWSNKMVLDIPLPVPIRVVEFGVCFSYDAHHADMDAISLASFPPLGECCYSIGKNFEEVGSQLDLERIPDYSAKPIAKQRVVGLKAPIEIQDTKQLWFRTSRFDTFEESIPEEPGYYNVALHIYYPYGQRNSISKEYLPADFDLRKFDLKTDKFASFNRVPISPSFPVERGQNLGLLFEPHLEEPIDFTAFQNPKFPRMPWFDGNLFGAAIDEVDGKQITRLEGRNAGYYFLCEVQMSHDY